DRHAGSTSFHICKAARQICALIIFLKNVTESEGRRSILRNCPRPQTVNEGYGSGVLRPHEGAFWRSVLWADTHISPKIAIGRNDDSPVRRIRNLVKKARAFGNCP